MGIKSKIERVDAYAKVTGQAKYTEDLVPANAHVIRLLHSTIANGVVKSINIDEALKVDGVDFIITCFDVPKKQFATAGHPHSIDPAHLDVVNRNILTSRVRYYGDDIAAVVAVNKIQADKALKLIKVEYDEFEPYIYPSDSVGADKPLHEQYPENVLARMDFEIKDGNVDFGTAEFTEKEEIGEGTGLYGDYYHLPTVQHAHIENICSLACMEGDQFIVYSPNQAPHTLRHHIADAIGKPLSRIRVVKPYVGGGFGNKQDTFYEPLLCLATEKLCGEPVYITLDREETFINSRVRHAMDIRTALKYTDDGIFTDKAVRIHNYAGAYGSNGHSVAAYAVTNFFELYPVKGKAIGESMTFLSNLPTSAAMRGYGIPQITFAVESQIDDIAYDNNWDPIELRLKNIMPENFLDPFDKFNCVSNGVRACIQRGRELIAWDRKRKEYDEYNKGQSYIKKGVGMAAFTYKTGVYPIQLETASARMLLNEDGTVNLQIGAIEIGQGSDTVMVQIASEVTGIPEEKIHLVSMQDTDVSPHDAGAYASRQTYVSGAAVKKTAQQLVDTLIDRAAFISGKKVENLKLEKEVIYDINTGEKVTDIAEIALKMQYKNDKDKDSEHITAEATFTAHSNCFSFGVSFADIEVDIMTGEITVKHIAAVHDSGTIINRELAEGQVRGGVVMGMGYALGEEMLFDSKGKPLNNNLLDYKMPTSMDVPDIDVDFVETYEPTGPFGNKALAEPPTIPQGPAIRNALLHATGVKMYELPMTAQRVVEALNENKK